jgi:hypothetical protein
MSKQVEVPEGLAQAVAMHLTSHAGNEIICLGIDAVDEVLTETALPALHQAFLSDFEERLLSGQAVLAAAKASHPMWSAFKASERTRALIETGNGLRAALQAVSIPACEFPDPEELERAKQSGVCPTCQGHGGGEEPEGHEYSDCEGTCPECWCPGCHDGHDFPESRISELDDEDPCGSWLAYELIHGAVSIPEEGERQ